MLQMIGQQEGGRWFPFAVFLGWTVLSVAAFGLFYRRKRLD